MLFLNHSQLIIGKRLSCRTPQSSLVLTNKPLQEEVVLEEVSKQVCHTGRYCGPAGGYEDIAECRKTELNVTCHLKLCLLSNKKHVPIWCLIDQRR